MDLVSIPSHENTMKDKNFFTVRETVEALGNVVSKQYLYYLIRNNKIPSVAIGNKIVIPAAWVQRQLEMSNMTEVVS